MRRSHVKISQIDFNVALPPALIPEFHPKIGISVLWRWWEFRPKFWASVIFIAHAFEKLSIFCPMVSSLKITPL
jgi:hypothetical protein